MTGMAPTPKKPRVSELYHWRIAKGWTQDEMAKELGISVRTLQRWEESKRLPKKYQRAFEDLKTKNP